MGKPRLSWLRWLCLEFLDPSGKNVIAVRVFDALLHGGIWEGPVGLATRQQYRRWQARQSSLKDFFFEIFK